MEMILYQKAIINPPRFTKEDGVRGERKSAIRKERMMEISKREGVGGKIQKDGKGERAKERKSE